MIIIMIIMIIIIASTTTMNHIYIDNHPMINFGSCSYLGLEKHEQLKKGVVNAVLNNVGGGFESKAEITLCESNDTRSLQ